MGTKFSSGRQGGKTYKAEAGELKPVGQVGEQLCMPWRPSLSREERSALSISKIDLVAREKINSGFEASPM